MSRIPSSLIPNSFLTGPPIMPFIPPSLSSPDAYLMHAPAQASFKISHPPIEIPQMPSLPTSDAMISFIHTAYQAIAQFLVEIGTAMGQFVKDHPAEAKVGAIAVLVAAIILSWIVLPVLVYLLTAISTGLAHIVSFVFRPILQLLVWLAKGVLKLVGFTPRGVSRGSVAAHVQSAAYGGHTTGVFSNLQRQGAIIGR